MINIVFKHFCLPCHISNKLLGLQMSVLLWKNLDTTNIVASHVLLRSVVLDFESLQPSREEDDI